MNKIEFLNQLRERLQGLPQEEANDRVVFYREIIDEMIADGKTEDEALAELGGVDKVVEDITSETSLTKLVVEKFRPRRELRIFEIVLLVLGFPLWFPLLILAGILALISYLLIWMLVIICYVIEFSLVVASFGGLIGFFAYLFDGTANWIVLGEAILAAGIAIFFFFACKAATTMTLRLSKTILIKIKTAIMRKGRVQK